MMMTADPRTYQLIQRLFETEGVREAGGAHCLFSLI